MKLYYQNPLNAVFLRTIAWECYVAQNAPRMKDAKLQLQIARKELGLDPLNPAGGALDDYIQKLRDKNLITPKNTPPAPAEKEWETEWRLQYLPLHSQIRQLSYNPITDMPLSASSQYVVPNATPFHLTLRDTVLPPLEIICGKPDDSQFLKMCTDKRGLYFLRMPDKLYLGKSDEGQVRFRQHSKTKTISWIIFISLCKGEEYFSLDSLHAAEALLISFWNEICEIANGNRGQDREPAFPFLQQAILLTKSASASLIWLMRETQSSLPNWNLPFQKMRSGVGQWPDCYMNN